jgi:phosphopantothenoylcysteine decarboxylase/phosphopantothenate--cysteine ligase
LGDSKKEGQLIVGFALETDDEVKNATKKLHNKNFDMIVLNSLKDKGAGFGYNTNKVSFLTRDNKLTEFELKSKEDVAKDIVDAIVDILSKS